MPLRTAAPFACLITFLAGSVALWGCALYLPELHLQGDLEDVETQLVGSFEETAPVVSVFPEEFYLTRMDLPPEGWENGAVDLSARASALADIVRWMREGWIGEGKDGKLVVAPVSGDTTALPAQLMVRVRRENEFRERALRTLFLLGKRRGLSPAEVKERVVRLLQSRAPRGTWIQNALGSWSRKGEQEK